MIPQRVWYPIAECAELHGCSAEALRDRIRAGKRTNPPSDSIPPPMVKYIGNRACIHRSFLFPDEPTNVVPFRADSDEHTIQLMQTALERFATEFLARFADVAPRSRKAS